MPTHCATCRSELSPDALVCPACGALVYAEELKRLAARATAAETDDLPEATRLWTEVLAALPAHSRQHAVVRGRVAELSARLTARTDTRRGGPKDTTGAEPWWRRAAPAGVTAIVFALGKLKFLLLGLTKASTFISMFAFFGVYWSIYGWPLALGLVVAIYVHEMGHVAMLRRLGINASAPLFIPGVGALVMLKQRVTDPLTDAKIGLAGPVWGLGAALAAAAIYALTRQPIWLAIAQLAGFLNLFNLIPIWQLDGSRGFHVLARWERWAVVGVVIVALAITEQSMLVLIGLVAAWRAFESESGPGDVGVLATFSGLVLALSWLARGVR